MHSNVLKSEVVKHDTFCFSRTYATSIHFLTYLNAVDGEVDAHFSQSLMGSPIKALTNQSDAFLTSAITFIPRLDSALFSPSSSRKTTSRAALQRLPSPSPDQSDAISVHTADADGDVDDEEVVEKALLDISSPTKESDSRQSPETQNIATPIWEDLFGSEPSPAEHQRSATPQPTPRRSRLVMSHVLVPPLRKPKESYTQMFRRKKVRRPAVDPHMDVALALQACFQHNHGLDTPSERKGKPKPKPKPKPLHPPQSRAEDEVRKLPTSHVKTVSSKRRIILSDDEGEEHLPPKRRRLDTFIDLTISEDDEPLAKARDVHRQKAPPPPPDPNLIMIHPHTPISPDALICNLRNACPQAAQKILPLPNDVSARFVTSSRRRCAFVDKERLDRRGAIEESAKRNTVSDDEIDDDLHPQGGSVAVRRSSSCKASHQSMSSTAPKGDLPARVPPKNAVSPTTVTNQTIPRPISSMSTHDLDEEDHPIIPDDPQHKPSAKALGKRKAIDPVTHLPTPSSLSPTTASNPQSPQPGLRPTGSGDIFINSFNPSPSQVSTFIHDDASLPSNRSPGHNELPSFSKYGKDSAMLPASLSRLGSSSQPQDDFSLADTALDDESRLGSHESWSMFMDDEVVRSYTFDTVNPTLLLGPEDFPVAFETNQQDGTSTEDPQPPTLTASGSSIHSPVPASPSDSSTSSTFAPSLAEKTMNRRSPSPLILPAPHVGSPPRSPPRFWQSGSVIPKRQRKQRLMKDMVPVEDAVASSYAPSTAPTDEDTHSEDGSTILVKRPTETRRVPEKNQSPQSRFLDHMFEKTDGEFTMCGGVKWPKGAAIFCHQCRNKTGILKLDCAVCNKAYCVRCLYIRYPNEPQAFEMETSSCPSCSQYCNCTACCHRRGVAYVPSKKPSRKRTAPSTESDDRQSTRPRIALAGKTNLPPLITSKESLPVDEEHYSSSAASNQPPPGERVYWSTIYGLNGAKIGTSFAPPNRTVGPPDMVYTTKPADPVPSSSKRSSVPVVWVGKIQPSWGLGQFVETKELDPAPNVKYRKSSSHRNYPVYCEPRMYVGKRSLLFCQSEAAAKELADLSDLTDLDDEGDRTSEYSFDSRASTPFCADSLTERDIKRAMELALAACGIPVLN